MQLIAYISMLIDHACKFAFKGFTYNPLLGRLAMPIFAYLIAIGMKRSSNKIKYIFRLFIFSVISQIPFILMIYGLPKINLNINNILQIINHFTQSFNIGFTFLIAALSIYFIDKNKKNYLNIIIILIISMFVVKELNTDYTIFGLLTVYIFYYLKNKKTISIIYLLLTTFYIFSNSLKEDFTLDSLFIERLKSYFSVLALPIIFWLKENKKVDNKFVRFIKYTIYPVHMLIIYIVVTLI